MQKLNISGCVFYLLFWGVIGLIILSSCGRAETSIVEIPIRVNKEYLKRVPGKMEFVYIGWVSDSGRMIAIPESRIQEFVDLAEELEIDPIGHPQAVVSNVLTVKVEIIHEEGLSFWMDEGAYWISWEGNDPPVATVNGTEIVFYSNPPFPRAPVLINIEE
jgi:hypothetical protein